MVGFVIGKNIGNVNMIGFTVTITDVGIMMLLQTQKKNIVIGITITKWSDSLLRSAR